MDQMDVYKRTEREKEKKTICWRRGTERGLGGSTLLPWKPKGPGE
jgi:hypothetical protein